MFKLMVFFSACCYLQSFILSFHGRRQAISCLLNLMAPLSPRSALLGTQPTPPDLSLFSLGPAWNVYKHINTVLTIPEVPEEDPGQGLTV